jgi:F-type H+-transporting ATPase subunit alpha
MTELAITPDEIRSALQTYVDSYTPSTEREEVGRVIEAGDGIARVEGLHSAMTNELLSFPGGAVGLALNLDAREIGAVILGDPTAIEEGSEVRRTGEVLSVPVGDGYLGRVVDGLGKLSTARARSSRRPAGRWSCRPPRSCSGSPSASRCRPASRPSTP